MSWIDAIGSATKALAVPYGYTLTMWAAGMLAVTKYGHPSLWNILGFVLGASAAYMLFDIAALKTTLNNGASFPLQIPSSALLNFLPVVPAMLSAIVAREVPSKRIGFPIMGFAASGFYILSLATLFWAWDHWG